MTSPRWSEISAILDTLLTLSKKDQNTYLDQHHSHDPDLVKEVRGFLESIEESEKEGFLDSQKQDHSALLSDIDSLDLSSSPVSRQVIGSQIGPFSISEKVGEGGMGSVYKAERNDGNFDQTVAIKFVNVRTLSDSVRDRFKTEQKILANLNHPNIARLFDGGVTDDGFPYLIMEYIDGLPIDKYCNKHGLGIDARLELFKTLVQTVDHAHSNLIVHRDLKPSNILVDVDGNLKVLDFGVAKLIDEQTEKDIRLTQSGERIWTPQYAAPEQILERPTRTQTDIYGLGVLLHKLLTNGVPFDLSQKSVHEVEEVILKSRPRSMNAEIGSQSMESISSNFGASKESLQKLVSGDLQSIVDKCLRKEAGDRFGTASELFEDIERYQNDYPVASSKGNLRYKTRKYLKRHYKGISIAAVVVIVFITTVSVYTYRLQQERNDALYQMGRAETASRILGSFFSQVSPTNSEGEEFTANDLLDNGLALTDTVSNPDVKADLQFVIGEAFYKLGNYDKAIEVLDTSYSISFEVNGFDNTKPALRLSTLGEIYARKNDGETASEHLDKAIEHYEKAPGDNRYLLSTALNRSGDIDFLSGNFEQALEHHLTAYELQLQMYDSLDLKVAGTLSAMGSVYNSLGRFSESLDIIDKLITIYTNEYGAENPRTIEQQSSKAIVNYSLGNKKEAREISREVLDLKRKIYKQAHPSLGVEYHSLGRIESGLGNYEAADSLLGKAIEVYQQVFGPEHVRIALATHLLGVSRGKQDAFNEADSLFRNGLQILRKYFPPQNSYITTNITEYGAFLTDHQRFDRALELLLNRENELSEASLKSRQGGLLMQSIGEAYLRSGDYENSEEYLTKSLSTMQEHGNALLNDEENSKKLLLELYQEWGKPEKVAIYQQVTDS